MGGPGGNPGPAQRSTLLHRPMRPFIMPDTSTRRRGRALVGTLAAAAVMACGSTDRAAESAAVPADTTPAWTRLPVGAADRETAVLTTVAHQNALLAMGVARADSALLLGLLADSVRISIPDTTVTGREASINVLLAFGRQRDLSAYERQVTATVDSVPGVVEASGRLRLITARTPADTVVETVGFTSRWRVAASEDWVLLSDSLWPVPAAAKRRPR